MVVVGEVVSVVVVNGVAGEVVRWRGGGLVLSTSSKSVSNQRVVRCVGPGFGRRPLVFGVYCLVSLL